MKTKIAFLLVFFVFFSFTAPVSAQSTGWYFKPGTNGEQPQVNGGKLYREYGTLSLGPADEKVIYLTFDAGYENGNVKRILDVLHRQDVPGAFFILPNLIKQNLDLINRMTEEGHTVCNHSYSHKNVSNMTKEQISAELTKLEDAYYQATGKQMSKYFRPPEGSYSPQSLAYLQELGYTTVFWSFAYADWDNNSQKGTEWAKDKILSNVHNGMVMLLHPTSKTNADILDEVINELKSRGYRFGTLDELNQATVSVSKLEDYKNQGVVLAENREAGKYLALTFDDGPDPVYTEKILNILDKYNARATFFMIGSNIEKNPEIAKLVIDRGHEAANHTFSHCTMRTVSGDKLIEEINRTQRLLQELGSDTLLFRPPGGDFSSANIETVSSLGYRYVLWSWRQDTKDWSCPSVSYVVNTVMKNLADGDIILFHDGNSGKSPTPEALEIILPRLIEMGYRFVTVSELFPLKYQCRQ